MGDTPQFDPSAPHEAAAAPAAFDPSSAYDAAPKQTTGMGELAEMANEAAKNLIKMSGPHVFYEALRKGFPELGKRLPPVMGGMPNSDEVLATGLMSMIPEAAEGLGSAGESAMEAGSIVKGATAGATERTGLIGRMLRKVPKLGTLLKAGDMVDDIANSMKPPVAAPEAATPAAVPEGWGRGKFGTPVADWGKRVTPPAPGSALAAPAASADVPKPVGSELGTVPAPSTTVQAPPDVVKPPVRLVRNATTGRMQRADTALLQQAETLQQPVKQAIDDFVPPNGATKAQNTRITSEVNFYLKKGDLAGAQNAVKGVPNLEQRLAKLLQETTREHEAEGIEAGVENTPKEDLTDQLIKSLNKVKK